MLSVSTYICPPPAPACPRWSPSSARFGLGSWFQHGLTLAHVLRDARPPRAPWPAPSAAVSPRPQMLPPQPRLGRRGRRARRRPPRRATSSSSHGLGTQRGPGGDGGRGGAPAAGGRGAAVPPPVTILTFVLCRGWVFGAGGPPRERSPPAGGQLRRRSRAVGPGGVAVRRRAVHYASDLTEPCPVLTPGATTGLFTVRRRRRGLPARASPCLHATAAILCSRCVGQQHGLLQLPRRPRGCPSRPTRRRARRATPGGTPRARPAGGRRLRRHLRGLSSPPFETPVRKTRAVSTQAAASSWSSAAGAPPGVARRARRRVGHEEVLAVGEAAEARAVRELGGGSGPRRAGR